MSKLKFPEHERVEQDLFRNLNGHGARRQMILLLVVVAIMTALWIGIACVEGVDLVKLCVGGGILWVWIFIIRHYCNASVVDHSPEALRVTIRGEPYLIPDTDVLQAVEKRLPTGGTVWIGLGSASSRVITVKLKTKYPFGHSFSFLTKPDYSDLEGPSGVVKLIQQYASKAAAKE